MEISPRGPDAMKNPAGVGISGCSPRDGGPEESAMRDSSGNLRSKYRISAMVKFPVRLNHDLMTLRAPKMAAQGNIPLEVTNVKDERKSIPR